jgi:ketosteroid isomerase-like protein
VPPHAPAQQPDDLPRLFLERANAGDVEGLVALYEPTAVLAFPPGHLSVGHDQIRRTYQQLLATRPTFTAGPQAPTLRNGDYALTSTALPTGGATAEGAHRQPAGTWRWILDNPTLPT